MAYFFVTTESGKEKQEAGKKMQYDIEPLCMCYVAEILDATGTRMKKTFI